LVLGGWGCKQATSAGTQWPARRKQERKGADRKGFCFMPVSGVPLPKTANGGKRAAF
jgi:hypothetical protein